MQQGALCVTMHAPLNTLGLLSFFQDPAIIQQVDGLGRNATMYCVHGSTPAHTECLEMLIDANCDLDHQANGKKFGNSIHVLGQYCQECLVKIHSNSI